MGQPDKKRKLGEIKETEDQIEKPKRLKINDAADECGPDDQTT